MKKEMLKFFFLKVLLLVVIFAFVDIYSFQFRFSFEFNLYFYIFILFYFVLFCFSFVFVFFRFCLIFNLILVILFFVYMRYNPEIGVVTFGNFVTVERVLTFDERVLYLNCFFQDSSIVNSLSSDKDHYSILYEEIKCIGQVTYLEYLQFLYDY